METQQVCKTRLFLALSLCNSSIIIGSTIWLLILQLQICNYLILVRFMGNMLETKTSLKVLPILSLCFQDNLLKFIYFKTLFSSSLQCGWISASKPIIFFKWTFLVIKCLLSAKTVPKFTTHGAGKSSEQAAKTSQH